MRSYADVIKLLDAGYSREEILEMDEGVENQESPETSETSDPDKINPVNDAVTMALNEVKSVIEDFKKEVTAMNIMNSSQQAPGKQITGEEILANIINPQFTKEEK